MWCITSFIPPSERKNLIQSRLRTEYQMLHAKWILIGLVTYKKYVSSICLSFSDNGMICFIHEGHPQLLFDVYC